MKNLRFGDHVIVETFGNFTLTFDRLRERILLKCVAARVARLFFLVQPIRSLFSGVVFAVAFVLAETQ